MARMNPALLTTFQDRMNRNQDAVLEDADLIGKGVHFHHSASCSIRNAVGVASNTDHTFPRHAAFQLQDGFERGQR